MSDYPKIDDFLDAVEDSTDHTWNSGIQHLYTEALKECVFADRVVKEMLPHQWEDWVIEGLAENTPSVKWMSSMAPQFWGGHIEQGIPFSQINILLLAGCALEHSNVGHNYLGASGKGSATTAIAKRLTQTDDDTIVGVLEASSKHSTTVGATLLLALVQENWNFNRIWENSPHFQKWIQRMVKMSNGGSIFVPLIAGFSASNWEQFSQWVVDFMVEENHKKDKASRNMNRFDQIFEQMPANVAQKWIDHLSNHSPNPQMYGPLVSALLQNKQLREVVESQPVSDVARRRM